MIAPAQWLITDKVIYAFGMGRTSNVELRDHSNRVVDLLDSVDKPVHIILHSTQDFRPETVDIHTGLDSLRFLRHRNLGWAVQVLHINSTMRFVSRMIARIARVNYQIVETVDDAKRYLSMVDGSIDWTQQIDDMIVFDKY